MTFWRSMRVSVSHFQDYILFIKIAVLTALPGRAELSLGLAVLYTIGGVPALQQLVEVKYNLQNWVRVPRLPFMTWTVGAFVARRCWARVYSTWRVLLVTTSQTSQSGTREAVFLTPGSW